MPNAGGAMNNRILQLAAFVFCLALTGAIGCQGGQGGGSGCGGANNNNTATESKPNCGKGTHQQGNVCVADAPPK
jgi:hypothetical protein